MTIRRYPEYIQGLDGKYFVSAESILKHGSYSFTYPPPEVAGRGGGHAVSGSGQVVTVRTTGDGPYAQRYQAMYRQVTERVRGDPQLSALLALPSWNKEQRTQWEARLAGIVADVHRQDPVLGDYRLTDPQKVPDDFNNVVTDPSTWYVCEQMAVTKSLLMQQAEQEMLGRVQGGGLKQVGQYFIQSGDVKPVLNAFGNPSYRHANIISSATGAVIEATANGFGASVPTAENAAYHVHVNPGFTADHAFAGYPMLTRPRYPFTREDGSTGLGSFLSSTVKSFSYGAIDMEANQHRMQRRYELLRAGRTGDAEFTPHLPINGAAELTLGPDAIAGLSGIFRSRSGGISGVPVEPKPGGEVAGHLQDQATEQCEADCSWPAIAERLARAGLPTEPHVRENGGQDSWLSAGPGEKLEKQKVQHGR